MTKKIGFVGLGRMGSGMAQNLLKKGYSLFVYSRPGHPSEETANALVKLGAQKVNSLRVLAAKSNVIISSLPSPKEVEEVYLGEGGILRGSKEGMIIIEMSTIDPLTTRKIAKIATEKGVKMIDAPVSGGPKKAADGTLVFMVGGEEEIVRECRDILEALGKTINHVGGIGSGNVVKLVNNVMSMGNIVVACEAFILGVKAGVPPDTLYSALRTGRGSSIQFVERFRDKILKNDFSPWFTIDSVRKDLGLAVTLANELKTPLPLASLILQCYNMASAMGLGNEDQSSVVKVFEEYAQVKARAGK